MRKKEIKEDAPANAGGVGVALGDAGASKDTVSGHDKPLKKKIVRRKSFKEFVG